MSVKLLANENFPLQSVRVLRAAGHDVLAICEHAPGITDSEVLALAASQQRWILTFDRDYGELIFARGLPPPPALIYLKLASYRPQEPGQLVLQLLTLDTPLAGYFITLDNDGLRKRPLPSA